MNFIITRPPLPELVLHRLTREACQHLSSKDATKSLRDLCKQFLKENPIRQKRWGA